MSSAEVESAILAAVRSGGLVRIRLEPEVNAASARGLWVRPDIDRLVGTERLDPRKMVKVALMRFVSGRDLVVVMKESPHHEVEKLGDIRELKGPAPPFLEFRFRSPPFDLRLFGRCIGKDQLILTSFGVKSLTENTGHRPLDVRDHRVRCDFLFRQWGLGHRESPKDITQSFSNAEFV